MDNNTGRLEDENEPRVYTLGHSAHSYQKFLSLLRVAGVTAIADVRTSPFSRFSPHFNREQLKANLRADGIDYRFLGKQLGGRPNANSLYHNGVADYEAMAKTSEFAKGLDRIVEGAQKHRLAIICSEHDPLDCHRCLLVARALAERGVEVRHILQDGKIFAQEEIEDRLLELSGREAEDLFTPRADRLDAAYRERSQKVAYASPRNNPKGPIAAE